MKRAYNFSAGPAVMPEVVLTKIQGELLNWAGTGMSVMEISHRSDLFVALAEKVERDIRNLANVPDNYKVLFVHGGARHQFSMIPQNLISLKPAHISAQLITGHWSKMAAKEMGLFGKVSVVADGADLNYMSVPDVSTWQNNADASFMHYCDNETLTGLEFKVAPDSGSIPLVADMSSNIFSKPIDVSKYGLIYACGQKNLGLSGITLVIVREDLLGSALDKTPMMLDYKRMSDKKSMLNTPPTFAWYALGLIVEWIEQQGGLLELDKLNTQKSQYLYDFIDRSSFYQNNVDAAYRSRMNVTFSLKDPEMDASFLALALKENLHFLKGHRAVGGMRASLYNAMSFEGVKTLVAFMTEFERNV